MLQVRLYFFGALGFFALLLTHFYGLHWVPGWHLDESWAAQFSYKILTEPGFWPIQAMSAYTGSWSHYLTSLFFKVFGTNLVVYRASGLIQVCLGVVFIMASLWEIGEKKASVFLPWLIAFFPALVINHRWVIEMNTFYVLCAGLVSYGLSLRWKRGGSFQSDLLIILGIFLGTTSHILFLAPVLALWYCLYFSGNLSSRRDRALVMIVSLCLLPFFYLIGRTAEEHFKSVFLIGLAIGFLIIHLSSRSFFTAFPKLSRLLLKVPLIFGLILWVPFLVFGEGSWLALFSNGYLEVPYLVGWTLLPCVLTAFFLLRARFKFPHMAVISFLPLSWLLITLMVTKPGPRYYEVPYLWSVVLLAIGMSRLKYRPCAAVFSLWVIFGGAQISLNYFNPSFQGKQIDRVYRLWRFRDCSGDFLPKQRLVERLAQNGCRYSDLKIDDPRMRVDLEFLAVGDWNVAPNAKCNFGSQVEIQTLDNPPETDEEKRSVNRVGVFKIDRGGGG